MVSVLIARLSQQKDNESLATSSLFLVHEEERPVCLAFIAFLISCFVVLPYGDFGWSAVCDHTYVLLEIVLLEFE